MEDRFKVGDQVQLKSGGPVMTVEMKINDRSYRCQWFAGKNLETGVFAPDSLQEPEDDSPKAR
jgi:uncharacterized protein YodC (DUF2158 family)